MRCATREGITMKKLMGVSLSSVAVLLLVLSGSAQAVTVSTVPVGNLGNTADSTTGFGAVSYAYSIGTYEVTAEQYTAFLNAVAATDTYGLYNPGMAGEPGAGIVRSGSPGSYTYSISDSNYNNRPVTHIKWGDAARFANWMHNGQPTGPQGAGTTEAGSYNLNGAVSDAALMLVTRQAAATWVIPTENEWYKAAYHKNDGDTGNYWLFPTQSNATPGRDLADASGNNANYYGSGIPYPIDGIYRTTVVGEFQNSDSAYSTFDQGGNVFEWNEAAISAGTRGFRGIGWGSGDGFNMSSGVYFDDVPNTVRGDLGFRLVNVVPEPSTVMMIATGLVGLLVYGCQKRK